MAERPCLLLIRPKAQSEAFLADCEARLKRRIQAVISPIIDIRPLGNVPDLDGFGTVIFSSANGVKQLSDRLVGRKVVTVGHATADVARSFGADATAFGETASDLLDRAADLEPPVLVCRGVHSRVDLAAELQIQGISAKAVVVYDQVELPMTSEALAVLNGNKPVVVPLFSPRSAALLSQQPHSAPLKVFAISDAVKAAWIGEPLAMVAKAPTSKAVCDLVTVAL